MLPKEIRNALGVTAEDIIAKDEDEIKDSRQRLKEAERINMQKEKRPKKLRILETELSEPKPGLINSGQTWKMNQNCASCSKGSKTTEPILITQKKKWLPLKNKQSRREASK